MPCQKKVLNRFELFKTFSILGAGAGMKAKLKEKAESLLKVINSPTFVLEIELLERLLFKCKNQHRRSKMYQKIQAVSPY
jgi:hypothetical protein